MGKGEIARYEQFLLFPQCFEKACFPEESKDFVVSEWVNKILSQQLTYDRSYTSIHSLPNNLVFANLNLKVPESMVGLID